MWRLSSIALLILFVPVFIVKGDDFPSLISANASIAVVLDREYLEDAYETILEEIKVIMERVIREDLKNGGLIVYYYSWTMINYKKDFTAVFSITRCTDTWNIFKEAHSERLIMIALTEPNCPRLPRDKAFMIPVVPVGQELPQVVLDSKSSNAIRWKSAIILHDETFARDMISHVIISLSQESPDGYIEPSAISMFKLSSKSHEWDRKREIRKTLRSLPIRSVGSNFIAIVTQKTMKIVMELAKDAGLVNVFTQWLYVVSDTDDKTANFTEATHFIEEGDNIAIAYNMTRSDKSCVSGLACHSGELLRAFTLGLSKMIKQEQVVYGQISDEEWEVIRPSKQERRDKILEFMNEYIKEKSVCDNCTTWLIQTGEVWGNAYQSSSFNSNAESWWVRNNAVLESKLQFVGYWKPTTGMVMSDVLFPHITHKFRRKNFNIITFHNPPWQIISTNETGHAVIEESSGVVLDILKTISKRLNFTYTLHLSSQAVALTPTNYSLEDNHNSSLLDFHLLTSNIPSDVLQMLQENRIILAAIAATINSKYERFVDFTIPISVQPYSFLAARPKELSRIFLFLSPFTGDSWICLIFTMAIVGPVLYAINRLSPWYEHHGKVKTGGLGKIYNCFWYVYGALLQQGGLYLPEADSGRLVVGTWWLAVIVLATTYCGNLVAFLTFPKIETPITTISQLIDARGSVSWGMQTGTFLEDFLKSTEEPRYQTLYEHAMLYEEETAQIIQGVREGKHIHIDWKTNLQYIMKREFLLTDRCDFVLTAEEFLEEQIAFLMPKNNPYRDLINMELKNLHQMGFIQLWLKRYLPKKDRCWAKKESGEVENHTVNLKDMQGCFIVLLIGIFLGFMIIGIECCWYHRRKYMTHRVFKPFVN